jgi:hypothetical protein
VAVPPHLQVTTLTGEEYEPTEVQCVEEAIEVYMNAFHQKFQSRGGRRHRKRRLQMFQQYLVIQGTALKLKDIILSDGQRFMESLTNYFLTFRRKSKKLFEKVMRKRDGGASSES